MSKLYESFRNGFLSNEEFFKLAQERPYVFEDDIPPYQHRNSKYFTELDAFNVAEMIAHEDDPVKAILQYIENCRDEEDWLYLK